MVASVSGNGVLGRSKHERDRDVDDRKVTSQQQGKLGGKGNGMYRDASGTSEERAIKNPARWPGLTS